MLPLDVILFHAKGWPQLMDGTVVMGISNQLHNIENNFKVIQKYPELKSLPVILGECDPEGCAACGMATDPQNAYRNGTMYSSYTAASFTRIYELARCYNVRLIGAVTWAFEFEDQPWFYGYRDLATNGVDKPVLNVFRMFGMMNGTQVFTESNRHYGLQDVLDSGVRKTTTDIGAIASKEGHTVKVLVWNYHDKDINGVPENAIIAVSHVPPGSIAAKIYMIDKENSNSYTLWKKMGSPQKPTAAQIDALEKAGKLQCIVSKKITSQAGIVKVPLKLGRQGVAFIKLKW